jgi:nucleoside-diphosphate-sugar epimerase
MKKMRILLTGSTGFIGSHLLAKLIEMQQPVAIILRDNADTWRIKDLINKVTVIPGDLGDVQSLEKQILDFSPDVLIHLAWYGVENRFRNEYQQISLNLNHVSNLLEILEKTKIKKIIGFGSQGEYGPQEKPINEELKPTPTTFYGVAKLCAYQIMNLFCQQREIDFAWVRLFSIYGPNDNASWLIPTVIKEIMNNNSPALTEGKQLWDFLYVADAVDAIVSILCTDHARGIFNLGSGKAVTVRRVVESIRDVINPTIELGFGLVPYRPDQVMFLEANIERFKNITGWFPQVSLQQGLENTIVGYQSP